MSSSIVGLEIKFVNRKHEVCNQVFELYIPVAGNL